MLNELLDLIFPVSCVGCDRPGIALCPGCCAVLQHPVEHSPRPRPPDLPPIAVAGAYDGIVRVALLAYKERGRRELVRPLGLALGHAVWSVLAGARDGPARAVDLVPIPSRPAAARARGGDHMRRLARRAAAVLRESGVVAGVRPVLTLAAATRDSAGLSASERAQNIAGSMRARATSRPPVLVDDLVTTGATLAEAARALRAAGAEPLAAAAVAGTQRWAETRGGGDALSR